jgi:hypothetical protein
MSELLLQIHKDQSTFAPGDELAGVVTWLADTPPKSIDVRLLWQTAAQGHTDVHSVDALQINHPPREGRQEFRFTLPEGPCSLNGKLVTLTWAIEASIPGLSQRAEFILSPAGTPIALAPVPKS